jgi:segregation and condensation protein B
MANPTEAKQLIEAAIFASPEPVSVQELKRIFGNEVGIDVIRKLVEELREDWNGRSLELVNVATGWRFQTSAGFRPFIEKMQPEKQPRYSRAVMETLAIIAYRQPVTRGDVEDIRGVVVTTQIIQTLEARGWIDVVGHRDTPGRPALYATTKQFLDDLGLRSLQELPPLEEIARTLQLEPATSQPAANEPEPASEQENAEPAEPAAGGNTLQ